MIYVLTGNGKGKTTCALGMGLRAAGAGFNVLMVQFLKTGDSSENKIVKKIKNFKIRSFGRKGFAPFTEKDAALARQGFDFLKREAENHRLVIMDEINVAMKYKLIDVKKVISFLNSQGKKRDIVLTGRYCPQEIIRKADLVTEFKEVKHYFKKACLRRQGVKARKGIEF